MNEEEEIPDFLDAAADDDDNDELVPTAAPELEDDDEVAEIARGHFTEDEADDAKGSEIDAMGRAAGVPPNDGKIASVVEAVERRDDRRYELDPESADDGVERPK